ncbi:MAG: RHS repeat-associated core domain-containing protein, partial [Thermosynechococcaceae cyanobacterium]
SDGNVLNHISYDSFGNVTGETNPDVDFRFSYTGREFDEETGQYYYRARYFDSGVGRFLSEDTIGFGGGDANLYRYVSNSPVNYTDPSGLMLENLITVPVGLLPSETSDFAKNWWEDAGKALVKDPLGTIRDGFEGSKLYAEELQKENARKLADPNKPWHEKILPAIGGGLNSLWTPCNADLTTDTLSAALLVDGFFIQPIKAAGGGGVLFRDVRSFGPGGGVSPGGCFIAGTPVLTPNGGKSIESLKIGDVVISTDPETGDVENQVIKNCFNKKVPVTLNIHIGPSTITCSPEHPFWVIKKGWVLAGNLTAGSQLLSEDGEIYTISLIERREGIFTVYNIEVDGFHTYHVSELSILVHNKASKPIRFGDGYSAPSDAYHRSIKPNILKKAGKFQGKVGKNPDIKVVNGKIQLKGSSTGPFKGKSYNTDLNASDFFAE